MKSISEINFKNEDLKELAFFLLKNGFEVAVPKETTSFPKVTYLHFGNDKGLAYVQIGDFGGICTLSSVHKPCKQTGTGYRLNNVNYPLSATQFIEAIDLKAPTWGTKNSPYIKKYKDIDDYISNDSYAKSHYEKITL